MHQVFHVWITLHASFCFLESFIQLYYIIHYYVKKHNNKRGGLLDFSTTKNFVSPIEKTLELSVNVHPSSMQEP